MWLLFVFVLVQVSHAAVLNMCKHHKQINELYPSREVAVCLDPYSGLGLVLWCLSGSVQHPLCVYSLTHSLSLSLSLSLSVSLCLSLSSVYAGHHSILINPWDLEQNPLLWLSILSHNKGKRECESLSCYRLYSI